MGGFRQEYAQTRIGAETMASEHAKWGATVHVTKLTDGTYMIQIFARKFGRVTKAK